MFRAPSEKFANAQFFKVKLSPRKASADVPPLELKTGDVVRVDNLKGDFIVAAFNRNYRCGKYVFSF
jgi:hypothetical protein